MKQRKSRETVFLSIAVSLMLVDILLPFDIPFLATLALGFMLNFLSFRKVIKGIGIVTLVFGFQVGIQWGVLIALFSSLFYFIGALVILPAGWLFFRRFKVRERLGR